MPNLDRFSDQNLVGGQALQEGLDGFELEKEEKKRVIVKERADQIHEIVNLFLEERTNEASERLKNLSFEEKGEVFNNIVLSGVDISHTDWFFKFDRLPISSQQVMFDIANRVENEDMIKDLYDIDILERLGTIRDWNLHNLILNKSGISVSDLMERKKYFPRLTEQEIIGRARSIANDGKEYIDWEKLMPYIDELPSVNRKEIVVETLNNGPAFDSGFLISYLNDLGISFRELIDLAQEKHSVSSLADGMNFMPGEYHQEIIDYSLDEEGLEKIMSNARHFDSTKINIKEVLKAAFENRERYKLFERHLFSLPKDWLQEIPQNIVNWLLLSFPDKIVCKINDFSKKIEIDKDDLVKKLLNNKDFDTVLYYWHELGLVLNDEYALKFIEAGGAQALIRHLHNYSDYSRKIYLLLFEIDKSISNKIKYFKGIKKADVYNSCGFMSFEGLGSIISGYLDFDGLELNQEFAEILVFAQNNENTIKAFLQNRSSFRNLDYKKLVSGILSFSDLELLFMHYVENLSPELFLIFENYLKENKKDKELSLFYLYFGDKDKWKTHLGEERYKEFILSLPKDKQRNERRNAFTHNDYDRTSAFLKYLFEQKLWSGEKEEIVFISEYIKNYGLSKQDKLYRYFRELKLLEAGKIEALSDEEQKKDGIISLKLLEKRYKKIQKLVFSNKELLAEDLSKLGSFEIELLDQVTGKSSHSFNGNGRSMKEMVNDFIDYSSNEKKDAYCYHESLKNEYVPVPEEYKLINIKSSAVSYEFDAEKLKAEDSYYNIFKIEILDVFDLETEDDRKLEKFVLNVKEKIELNKKILEEKKDIPFKEKQLKFYDDLLEKVSGVKSYDELLIEILKIKSKKRNRLNLTSDLRKIVFRKTLAHKISSGQDIEELRNHLLNSEASGEAVLALSNLIEILIKNHVLNLEGKNKDGYWTEEAWEQLLKLKKDKKQISVLNMFTPHLGELRKEVKSLIIIETGEGNVLVSCDPVGGFMGEMSAYLGKACYSAEYPLLARYPNLIPYRFTNNTDPDNKELLGSVLVFELESEEGEKVALLRAFNIPDETKVNVSKFIEDFIEGISSDLKARGIKKIIIPGAKGTISNHAMILRHMCQTYIDGKEPISLSKTFDFNRQGNNDSYDITHNCYVARKL